MNEEEIDQEYASWRSIISKYIISRSSKFLSAETQQDGRQLLMLSTLSTFFHLGIVQIKDLKVGGVAFQVSIIPMFISILSEGVCLYFALSFWTDAYSDLKVWQFSSLLKDSDGANPIESFAPQSKGITRKFNAIMDKYKELITNKQQELGLTGSVEQPPQTNDLKELQDYSDRMEIQYEKLTEMNVFSSICDASRQVEIQQLEVERNLLNFKIESFSNESKKIVRAYKFKRVINVVFPLASFVLSLAVLIYYLVRYR